MQYILEVCSAFKKFGSGDTAINALNGLSFHLQKGQFMAVMGASGSGKTTLLNVIATIEKLTSGDIFVDGIQLSRLNEKKLATFRRDKLGFIFQDYNLLDTLTIEENIALPLNLQRVNAKKTKQEVERISDILGLNSQLKKFPYELSGGERQRAACARAVITNPALILADEPTGALDSHNSKILMEQLQNINSQFGCTILMVTHDAIMASYSGSLLFLKDGKICDRLERGNADQKTYYHNILQISADLGEK